MTAGTLTAQILGVVVTIAFLSVIVRMVRRRKLRAKYSFLWLLVGISIVAMSVVPGLLGAMSNAAGIYYPPAFLFLCSTMFLLFLAVHFSWELSRLEDRVRTLAEEAGLARQQTVELSQRLERVERGAPTTTPALQPALNQPVGAGRALSEL